MQYMMHGREYNCSVGVEHIVTANAIHDAWKGISLFCRCRTYSNSKCNCSVGVEHIYMMHGREYNCSVGVEHMVTANAIHDVWKDLCT